ELRFACGRPGRNLSRRGEGNERCSTRRGFPTENGAARLGYKIGGGGFAGGRLTATTTGDAHGARLDSRYRGSTDLASLGRGRGIRGTRSGRGSLRRSKGHR